MIVLRKIDHYGQLILIVCMLLSIPFFYFFIFEIGLFLLGFWQLISALANTMAFIRLGYKKLILIYWAFWLLTLLLIAFFLLLENDLSKNLLLLIFFIITGVTVFTTAYYLKVYYRLIELFSFRNELDGLTKSKH